MGLKFASSVSLSRPHHYWAIVAVAAGATGVLRLPGVAQLPPAIVPADDDAAKPAKKVAPAAPLADAAIFGAPARSAATMAIPGAPIMPLAGDGKTPAATQQAKVTIEFRDVPVVELMQMIIQQGDVDIMIDSNVDDTLKISYIKLTDVTPQEAIRKAALTAGLKWKKIDAATYFVGRTLPVDDDPRHGQGDNGMYQVQPIIPGNIYNDSQNVRVLNSDDALPALGTRGFDPSQLFQLNEMKGRDNRDRDERDIRPIRVRNVRAGMIAWWLDPHHHPVPFEIAITQRNMQKANSPYRLQPGVDPAITQQINGNAPAMPFAQNYNPYVNPYVNPYANAQATRAQPTYRTNYAFGGGGGGGFGGGGGGGFGGGQQQQGGTTGGGLSGGGVLELPEGIDQLVAIDAQNVLLVYGTAEAVARLQTIIEFLDRPIRQVEIEAQFVDVSVSEAKGFGIQFFNRGSQPTGDDDDDAGSIPSIGAGVPGGNQITLTFKDYQARISYLTSTGRARIINSPRVTTMNNLSATLQSSQTTPIVLTQSTEGIGGQVGESQNAFFLETAVGIQVAPTINNDDTVTVFLRPFVETQVPTPALVQGGGGDDDDDDGGGGGTSIPTVLSQELTTVANVKDNDVIVLGGLRTRTESIVRTRIPILSRLPIIGRLFRSYNRTDVDRELVIFLTARVLRRSGDETPMPGP